MSDRIELPEDDLYHDWSDHDTADRLDRKKLERDYWDKAALDPEVDEKYISDISTEECIDALDPDGEDYLEGVLAPGMILDIGCGVGRIANQVGAVGIDISEKMLEIARRNAIWPSQYHLSDGRTIPFSDETFDSAYSMLLFQHLEGPTIYGYMQEVFRVLKPGGMFRFQYIPGTEREPFSNHYDTKQIRKWLKLSGLEFVKEDEGLCHPQWSWVTARKPQA